MSSILSFRKTGLGWVLENVHTHKNPSQWFPSSLNPDGRTFHEPNLIRILGLYKLSKVHLAFWFKRLTQFQCTLTKLRKTHNGHEGEKLKLNGKWKWNCEVHTANIERCLCDYSVNNASEDTSVYQVATNNTTLQLVVNATNSILQMVNIDIMTCVLCRVRIHLCSKISQWKRAKRSSVRSLFIVEQIVATVLCYLSTPFTQPSRVLAGSIQKLIAVQKVACSPLRSGAQRLERKDWVANKTLSATSRCNPPFI